MTYRQHFLPEYKGGGVKKTYATEEEAIEAAERARPSRPLIEHYPCSVCSLFHLGNRRLSDEEWEAEQIRRASMTKELEPITCPHCFGATSPDEEHCGWCGEWIPR
jgi:hypothetical protein